MGYHQLVEIRLISSETIKAISCLQALMREKKMFLGQGENPRIIFADLSSSSKLGYYDSMQNLIVLEAGLASKGREDDMGSVFLHELAHFKNWNENGLLDHGSAFHECCRILGVPEGFEKAKVVRNGEKRRSALRRIEKLMALSSSPFEAESAAALKKAQAMMLEYNIASEDGQDRLYAVAVLRKNRFFYHEKILMQVVQMLSGAMNVIEKKRNDVNEAVFYGNIDQIEFAMYLWEHLAAEMEERAAVEGGRTRGFDKRSFYDGLAEGLLSRVRGNTADGLDKALILSINGNRNAYRRLMDTRLHTRSFHTTVRDASSYNDGKNASAGIRIPAKEKHAAMSKRIAAGKTT